LKDGAPQIGWASPEFPCCAGESSEGEGVGDDDQRYWGHFFELPFSFDGRDCSGAAGGLMDSAAFYGMLVQAPGTQPGVPVSSHANC